MPCPWCLSERRSAQHARTYVRRDLPRRAAARRAASQAAMQVLRPPGGHCCLSVRRRASISQAGTSAKRVRGLRHTNAKSDDCESRQTEGNLEHEIARPREAQQASEAPSACRPAEMNTHKRNITPISFRCEWHVCMRLHFGSPTEDPNSENADMIVTTIHVQPAA